MKSRVRKIHWKREELPTPVFLGFPCSSAGKESACNAGYLSSICELGRSPGEGKGYPLQYSGVENSMDCIVYGVTKGQTRLSYFHFFLKESALLPHHPQHSGVYMVPTLLSLHTLLVLDWAGQPERRGIPPAPADLTFSSLAAFLADPGTKQGNAS